MADEIDMANEVAQRMLDAQLTHRKPTSNLTPIGRCHWCEEEFEQGSLQLFCKDNGNACTMRHHRYHGI